MQEIKKTRIVIASVLKPVDDTRMFEKMGLSLASTGTAEVHIIGYPATRSPTSKDITFHSLKRFSRVSMNRVFAAWIIASKLIRLKPRLIIVTTHELLLGAVLTKFIRGSRVIYDVRENYFRNILYTNAFPALLRWAVALHVRFKEITAGIFVDHYILAERGYETEMDFIGQRKTVIENKLRRPEGAHQRVNKRITGSHLIFTGTLAESTGVFEALRLVCKLNETDPSISLTIIGYASKADVRNKLADAAKGKRFIKLVGIDRLVPHAEIIQAIQQADAGIISYPPNKSTENSIPTKVYEYAGCTLPIIAVGDQPWIELCHVWNAAIVTPPDNFDAPEFLRQLRETNFYTKVPANVYWDDEEKRFLSVVSGQK